MKNKRNPFLILPIALLLMVVSCKKQTAFDNPPSKVSIYDIVYADDNILSTFQYAIDVAGLKAKLKDGNYTVFAPTNAAFAAAGLTGVSMYAMDQDSLIAWVNNHVVNGVVDIKSLQDGQILNSIGGLPLLVQKVGSNTYLNGGDITNTYSATNGTLYLIDNTLTNRPTILQRLNAYVNGTTNSQFTFLSAAIIRASTGSTDFNALLDDSSKAYTLFAPNNGAFIDGGYATLAAVQAANPDVLGALLKYHILQGRKLTPDFDSVPPMTALSGENIYFDKVKATPWGYTMDYAEGIAFYGGSANMYGGEGVIHSISRFLPRLINMTTLTRIQSDTTLSSFSAAIATASQSGNVNFTKMLSEADSSFTVFAISNKAFRAAGYANAAAVTAMPADLLSDMLKYHIITKRLNNISVAPNTSVATLYTTIDNQTHLLVNGVIRLVTVTPNYTVQGTGNTTSITIAKANANIVTTNGLLNIIDTILLP